MDNYKATIYIDAGLHENSSGYHVWIDLTNPYGYSYQYSYGPATDAVANMIYGPGAMRDKSESLARANYSLEIELTEEMFYAMKQKGDSN
jgi:hypothetical protein